MLKRRRSDGAALVCASVGMLLGAATWIDGAVAEAVDPTPQAVTGALPEATKPA